MCVCARAESQFLARPAVRVCGPALCTHVSTVRTPPLACCSTPCAPPLRHLGHQALQSARPAPALLRAAHRQTPSPPPPRSGSAHSAVAPISACECAHTCGWAYDHRVPTGSYIGHRALASCMPHPAAPPQQPTTTLPCPALPCPVCPQHLSNQCVELVLTAHPTQALRASLLKKYAHVRRELDNLHNKRMSPYEKVRAAQGGWGCAADAPRASQAHRTGGTRLWCAWDLSAVLGRACLLFRGVHFSGGCMKLVRCPCPCPCRLRQQRQLVVVLLLLLMMMLLQQPFPKKQLCVFRFRLHALRAAKSSPVRSQPTPCCPHHVAHNMSPTTCRPHHVAHTICCTHHVAHTMSPTPCFFPHGNKRRPLIHVNLSCPHHVAHTMLPTPCFFLMGINAGPSFM